MAFIATAPNAQGEFYTLGVVRVIFGVDGQEAEFAMAVRSDEKQQGLGTLLLEKMLRYCRSKNLQTLTGVTMLENSGMANLARKLLEAFFSFKYPRNRSDLAQLLNDGHRNCVKTTAETKEQIYRFINRYSHSNLIEVDEEQSENLAGESISVIGAIFDWVHEVDPVHFDEMVAAVSA